MLYNVTVGSNQLDKAKEFYDELFRCIGVERAMDLVKGGACWGFGTTPEGRFRTMFVVLSPENGQPATVGNGSMVGLVFDTPEQVDAIYAKALELGGSSEGEPGLRETNVPGTYIAYFRDIEGHKFAAMARVTPELAASGTLRSIR